MCDQNYGLDSVRTIKIWKYPLLSKSFLDCLMIHFIILFLRYLTFTKVQYYFGVFYCNSDFRCILLQCKLTLRNLTMYE